MKRLLIALVVVAALATGLIASGMVPARMTDALHAWVSHARELLHEASAEKPTGAEAPRAALPPDKPEPADQASAGAAVTVARVHQETFVETVMVTGTLVPRDEILVSPEIEGLRVLELKVDEGDSVKQGQVLATLVPTTLQAQVAQSDASLARADAAIARAQSAISEFEAKVKEADAALERARPLTKSGYLSESTFDTREAMAKTMGAQLVAARDGLKVAQAEKQQVVAQRKELDWRLGNTDVKSPSDGVVSRRTARVGGLAMAMGEPMFRIIARGEVELDAEVPEEPLAKVRIGQKADIEVAGVGPVPGSVRIVSPEVDKATRLGRVRIFLGADPRIRIGAFGRGDIKTAQGKGLAVPMSAVLYDEKGASVQIVRDGKVVTSSVKTGLIAGGKVEIREGVALDDLVVARAGTFLRDGDAVRPIDPNATLSEAPASNATPVTP
jgi:HlyD family secretion protein